MRRSGTRLVLAVMLLACIPAAARAATPADCAALRRHGHRTEAQACYQSLTLAADPYLRAEGDWGLELYQDANNEFRTAVARADGNAHYRVRWGRLLHERFNDAEAVQAVRRSAGTRRARTPTRISASRSSRADGFDRKAREYAEKALELDPKLVEAREVLANLALEDSNRPKP